MKRLLLSLFTFLFLVGITNAQVSMTIPNITLNQTGGTVKVPINVTHFNNVGAVSLVISYDPNVLTFTGADNLPSHGTFLPPNAVNGQIFISWYDTTPLEIGNSMFARLEFNYSQGNSALSFVKSSCEVADSSAQVMNVTFNDGGITGPAVLNQLATLAGNVWIDANKDGLKNNGESGLQWVTVDLFNCGGSWLKWQMTDSQGNYSFDSLQPGSYYVRFTLNGGNKIFMFTTENVGSDSSINSRAAQLTDSTGITDCVTLTSNQVYSFLNAGVVEKNNNQDPHNASIGDYVWEDTDPNDGVQEPGDPGIPNVTVKLLTCSSDSVLTTTSTDNNGHYLFGNLAAGDYKVQFVLPQGYVFVVQHKGPDTTKDSDPNTSTGITDCISLTSGENLAAVDAGMFKTPGPGTPNLWITKDDGTDTAPDSGSSTTYKINFGNSGNGNLSNAVVVDTLPSGMTYVSSQGGNETSPGSNIVVFNLGSLNAGGSGEVELTAEVTGNESEYYNVAYLQGTDSQSNPIAASAYDLDVADTTSNSDNSGVESRGDMSELLLKRHLKIQYGMTTPILKTKGAKALTSLYNLSSFIPATGPFNSLPVEATPFDILGISNAVSSYAVNYELKTPKSDLRVGGIFSTVTAAPFIYDHLKAVCDRLAGYQVDEIKLVNINGYQFYSAKLAKANQSISDYAISFSVYETSSGYKVQNKWSYEDYQTPDGASSIYNFQVWASSYESAAQLAQNIIAKFQALNGVSYLNTNQVSPEVFIKSAEYTHDGNIHLSIANNSQTSKQISLYTSFRISQGDNQVSTTSNYSAAPGVSKLVVATGIISDANVYMTETQGFNDEVYVSGGAYTYLNGPNTTVNTFNTTGYPQQVASNYPQGSLILSGGASASGTLNDWATVVRSLTPENSQLDLSKFNGVSFTANGNGTIEVILNLSNTQNYNYYASKINLTGENKTYTIDFSQFKLLYGGSDALDSKLIEDIGFNINNVDNPGLTSFNFEVKNIAFVGNNVTVDNGSGNNIPKEFSLGQNYPNPFNPSTVISYSVPKLERLSLTIYNILGQKVLQLFNTEVAPGYHSITFDASRLSSGIYFYQLLGNSVNITKKMILTK